MPAAPYPPLQAAAVQEPLAAQPMVAPLHAEGDAYDGMLVDASQVQSSPLASLCCIFW